MEALLSQFKKYLVKKKRRKYSTAQRYASIIKKKMTGKKLTKTDEELESIALKHWLRFLDTIGTLQTKTFNEIPIEVKGDLVYVRGRDYLILMNGIKEVEKAIEQLNVADSGIHIFKVKGKLIIEGVKEFFDLRCYDD